MWDAGGHAVGILAPGGWIASTDPDGKTWDIWSIGYRNAYDMAFNADGELFAYDSDMEWDVGMPWYRPTRVVHATSGSEFGWRSGSGVWPDYYLDSLPPMINIGPGSPVGVEFGYGLKFPAKYQKALFLCDWTFGTMYAIHTEPNMSTYKATKEEFLSRTPLPLTDVVAGPDGAMYFTVGGRGTQSELFRVTYAGTEATSAVELAHQSKRRRADRMLRIEVETENAVACGDLAPAHTDASFIGLATFHGLKSKDRFLNSAWRNGIFDVALLHDNYKSALFAPGDFRDVFSESNPVVPPASFLTFVTAMAKGRYQHLQVRHKKTDDEIREIVAAARKQSVEMLLYPHFESLEVEEQRNYLRALSLMFLRLGAATDSDRDMFSKILEVHFPSDNDHLNRELCQMLVYLKSPTVIEKTVKLLEAPSKPTVTDDMKDLLARNRGYGGSIAASIEKASDQQQIWYAFCLRNLKEGWTMDQRKSYFAWFERAHQWSGGASYHGFLRNIEKEAFENASEKERLLIEASGARKPYVLPELPKPVGPGKDWTLEEVRALAAEGLKQRDFEHGQKMFAATRCIVCHRFGGDGGATGPDLTQLAGRFNLNDLTEATMVPSKVISDQYRGSTVVTKDGRTVNGRIVNESDEEITILTSPEDSTKITDIPKSMVEEIQPSAVSLMPADLLKPLNQDEVLNLLAYLLSRGDANHAMFR